MAQDKPESPPKPVVLCVLDGWGYREAAPDNAIALAKTPTYDRLWANFPHCLLDASAGAVGLPQGQMGNSEVGHMNIGAGRVVLQDLPRIDTAIEKGELATLPALRDFIAKLRQTGGRAHIMGLLSPGGVHSHQSHILALVKALDAAGIPVLLHAIFDGRDTPPKSARDYLSRFVGEAGDVAIATVSGRYYAMDRDSRWDRVEKAYRAIFKGEGLHAPDPLSAVDTAYESGQSDEFVHPTVIDGYSGQGYTGITKDDGILMANFRADRAREILESLLLEDFDGFARPNWVKPAVACGMTPYSARLDKAMTSLFPSGDLRDTLGEILSQAGKRQLRIAETEKYAHVTFFLNGGREAPFPGEDRILVPSPKVATYDLAPQMSAHEMTAKLQEAITSSRYDLIVVNYANADMVGHSGDLKAAIKAAEVIDDCLAQLQKSIAATGGAMLITADHGNLEQMRDPVSQSAHTAHTTNKVPAILIGAAAKGMSLNNGRLADIAPTLLDIMQMEKPAAMTGKSLIAVKKSSLAAE